MPKRSVAARGGAQRQKPRTQKSFELVRPGVKEKDDETEIGTVPAVQSVVTGTVAPKPQESRQPVRTLRRTSAAVSEPVVETKSEGAVATASKVSASTRMATRRQATQRAQGGSATPINAEQFAYVRRDLMIIATLAILMFAAIIVLYFVFGRGV